ncbi:MAG: chemotaxis protein CheB [Actinobacteria bacterium]|nr:chemotaxis protein CheB [Actinomycetota bacterium]
MDDRPSSVVVVGASAGGVAPLKEVLGALPADLQAAVLVVLHVSPTGSRLPEILNRSGRLHASHATSGEPLVAGRIYVAPPDHHLLVEDSHCVVARGPRENNMRPAIDPLFRSAARAYGPRVVGVVLSGSRDDGAVGAAAIARRGGCVIVQDPDEADFPGMPASAIARDHPDRVEPTASVAGAIVAAVENLSKEVPVSENERDEMAHETSYAELDRDTVERSYPPGEPSRFSCPSCGGVLWEVDDGLHRFRCRVGHAFTAEGVLDEEAEQIDNALWAAFRALQERADLSGRTARRSRERGSPAVAGRFDAYAREALDQAELIRSILLERDVPGG